MAEKIKDAEDQLLESMFALEAIADSGFSKCVVQRIRRRLWLQRLTLPVAVCIGAAIAIRPVSELAISAARLLTVIPRHFLEVPLAWIPQGQYVVIGAMLLVACALGMRILED